MKIEMHIRLYKSSGTDLGRSTAEVTDNIHAIGWPSSTVDFGWFVVFWLHQLFRVKINWKSNLVGLLYHPFWLYLIFAL